MPRGKFQQLSLEMAAISAASLMNVDCKRSVQASAKKGLLISVKICRCFLTALKQCPRGGISCCTKRSGQTGRLSLPWGSEAEASLAELPSSE